MSSITLLCYYDHIVYSILWFKKYKIFSYILINNILSILFHSEIQCAKWTKWWIHFLEDFLIRWLDPMAWWCHLVVECLEILVPWWIIWIILWIWWPVVITQVDHSAAAAVHLCHTHQMDLMANHKYIIIIQYVKGILFICFRVKYFLGI